MDLYDYTEYFFSHQKAQKNSFNNKPACQIAAIIIQYYADE